MQNHFNLTRFGYLFKKHTAEQYKTYLMSVVVLIGVIALVLGFIAYTSSHALVIRDQTVLYCFGLIAAGTIFTSTIFTNLSDKRTAISTLTLPASQLEKYLVAWLYSFVIFLIVYSLAYYLVASIVVNLDDWDGKPKELINIFENEHGLYTVYWTYIFLHAVAIWGAIFFRKLHFIKTGFTLFLALAILVFVNYIMLKTMLGTEIRSALPFRAVELIEYKNIDGKMFVVGWEDYNLDISEEYGNLIIICFTLMAVVMWVASYMRLKEKQV